MKKSQLIKIIKEEVRNILSEKETLASVDLGGMSKDELEELGVKTLYSLINDQCTMNKDGKYTTVACQTAVSVYRNLNPTGSI